MFPGNLFGLTPERQTISGFSIKISDDYSCNSDVVRTSQLLYHFFNW